MRARIKVIEKNKGEWSQRSWLVDNRHTRERVKSSKYIEHQRYKIIYYIKHEIFGNKTRTTDFTSISFDYLVPPRLHHQRPSFAT
jgi:hypothetical protein